MIVESSILRGTLVAILILGVQTSLMAEVRPFGIAGDLLLAFSIAAGMVAGPRRGATFAFALGVLYDLQLQTPLGLSALTYASAAYAAGFLPDEIVLALKSLQAIVAGVLSVVAVLFFAVVAALFGLERVLGLRLIRIVVVVAVINFFIAPLAVMVQRWALMAGDHHRA